MLPIIPTSMKYYTGPSAGYTGSSPYAVPSQPPFNDVARRPSRQTSFNLTPSHSPSRSSDSSISSNRQPLRPARTNSSSTSSTASFSRHNSTDSTNSSKSLTTSIKSIFNRPSPEERAAKKAEKQRQRRVAKAEREAYERAQEMEATAMYMAWSMF